MITVDELKAAIAECEGERNPNANTCIKLAAYYTILSEKEGRALPYSNSPAPTRPDIAPVVYVPDTDFGRAIQGKETASVIEVMDELMTVIQAIQPRLYDGVIRKIKEI